MVPPHGRVLSRNWRRVRGGILDGLNTGLLVVGEHGYQIRRGRAFLAPDLYLFVNMQNLHHLGVELGIGSLQIVPSLVGTHLVGAENLGNRSSPQFPETRLASGLRMLADMLCQQPRGPEFLSIAQIFWFVTGQSHHPSARFGGYRR